MTYSHDYAEHQLLVKYAKARLSVICERSSNIDGDVRRLRDEVNAYSEAWDVKAPATSLWDTYLFDDN